MKVISGLDRLESEVFSNVAATIGSFDGVHLGHRRIISTLLKISEEENLIPTLVTFEPHPQLVLGKRGPVEILTTLDEKLDILESSGIETVIVLEFNRQLASYPPEEFVRHILLEKMDTKALVIGYDHHFGKDRAGNTKLLEDMSKAEGFRFTIVPEFRIDGRTVKSTLIRNELKSGDFSSAREILGYNYLVSGKIVKGHGIGKTMGFPTINLAVPPVKLLPQKGVYSTAVSLDGSGYHGMAYIGERLTFDDASLSVEVNLFSFSGKVESEKVILELIEFIRPPEKFETVDELTNKIKEDELEIRKRFK
ncbi:MAG: bifunctional riboflavin kinase/FAD synthetase [candidate division Zixibacteria bacterium]